MKSNEWQNGKSGRKKGGNSLQPDNQEAVTLNLVKKDLYVLDQALAEYFVSMNKKHVAPLFPGDLLGNVDYEVGKKLRDILRKFIA